MRRVSGIAQLLLGLALLASGCKLGLFKRAEAPIALTKGPQIGLPAPEIDGEDFNGQRFKLSDYRGKVVVVAFWASWCKPCRDLVPHEQSLVQRFQNRPFILVGANIDENRDAALKTMASCGITWRNWRAGGDANPIQQRWNVELLPTIYVIDAKGIVRYTRVTGHHLDTAVETLLAEAEAKR